MNRKFFIIIVLAYTFLIIGCTQSKKKYEIAGIWYISKAINTETGSPIEFSFIDCPYIEFESNGYYHLENGSNFKKDYKWSKRNDTILLSSIYHNDTSFLIIEEISDKNMQLLWKDKEVKLFLTKNCD